MPKNVEIKARVGDLSSLRDRVESVADGPSVVIDQEDTFFASPEGRLKLRDFGDGRGELIHYDRPDESGPKSSRYTIAPTSNPQALKAILSSVLGVLGVVRKRRWLSFAGQTRIHLDRVEGLGDFLELEVVLRPEQGEGEGFAIAEDLMGRLGIGEDDLVEVAYIDLLGTEEMTRESTGGAGSPLRDRVRGVLVGLAVGDRIGGPLRMAIRLAGSLAERSRFDPDDVLDR